MSLDQYARPRIIRGPHAEGDPALLERAMRDVVRRHQSGSLMWLYMRGFIAGIIFGYLIALLG